MNIYTFFRSYFGFFTLYWGSSSIGHCASIHTHEQAANKFSERGPVKSIYWSSNERPLAEVSHRQLQLREEDGNYALRHYDTDLVYYYKPENSGERTVMLRGYNSSQSCQFLGHMDWATWHRHVRTVNGDSVLIPLSRYCNTEHPSVPLGWSAKLVFNSEGLLDTSKSAHRSAFIKRSSDEDKAARAEYMQKMDVVMELMLLRLPTFHAESRVSTTLGRSFAEVEFRAERTELLMGDVEVIAQMAQAVYNLALSTRMYHSDETGLLRLSEMMQGSSGTVTHPLDQQSFRRSLRTALIKHSGLAILELPQFSKELAGKWFT